MKPGKARDICRFVFPAVGTKKATARAIALLDPKIQYDLVIVAAGVGGGLNRVFEGVLVTVAD